MSTSARQPPGLPRPPAYRHRRANWWHVAEPGEPGLPLCHRSLQARPRVRSRLSARRPGASSWTRAPCFQRCLSPAVRWP